MRSSCNKRRRTGGFTLIEVLIALAVAGLALAAMAGVFGTGAIGHETAADANTALNLAEEKLAGAEAVAAIRPGRTAGSYAGRFDWRVSVAPYNDPDDPTAALAPAVNPLPSQSAAGLRLYRIEATVAWRDGRRQRQLAVSTLRLLPAAP